MDGCLLDTSAYVAFKRGHRAIHDALQRMSAIHLNPIVLGELTELLRAGDHTAYHLAELEAFLEIPRVRVLDLDGETADRYARILAGLRGRATPIPTNDLWIAASAMQHGLRVLTTDRHFREIPQVAVELHPPVGARVGLG